MSNSKPFFPLWLQISLGVLSLSVVALLSFKNTFYTSEWHRPDSNFYRNTTDALRQSNISIFQGDIPTLVVFWELDNAESKESLGALESISSYVNIVGIHLKTAEANKVEARRWWLENASRNSPVYFDDNNMLENTFVVRTAPANFLFFPKNKELLAHTGNIRWASPSIPNLVDSVD